ncbi:glycoside hydrolase family 95 protein [Flavobacterium circumlabens]|uniref:Glycoside hydrolase family 95 protein n=1 Tax=Flavobacterium circumlabens TaxID=2133765 RepID=A0A4Y7UEF2_9FLAO|nr:glycoside hydrolase N-terminal domain-containing protein [Flavobacterium circumlabens]TCN59549.1 glycosyl hydrolase family 65 [Flavobacterium circumlabens]TEB44840.1 glycoside hydrolase family 95 protein [Flavobacterium circumlabens]
MKKKSIKGICLRIFCFFFIIVSYQSFAQKKHPETTWKLWYNEPAPEIPKIYNDSLNKKSLVEATPVDRAWEEWSLPLGNGYFGASVFGRTTTERIQITENSMAGKSLYGGGGLTNFAELYIDFNHTTTSNYQRSLSLNNALSTIQYKQNGVTYNREYFASYPDKVLVIRLTADKKSKISFTLRPEIPYKKEFGKASNFNGRNGKVIAKNDLITLSGNGEYYGIKFEGQFKVIPTGGSMKAVNDQYGNNGKIEVTNANEVTIIVTVGTNYQLKPTIFTENNPSKKLAGNPDPHENVTSIIEKASSKTYKQLLESHQKDYENLFSRVNISLNSKIPEIPTDELLQNYKNGQIDHYLEELYFQYGRYLLICSSRPHTLPPNLQGIWSQYDVTPWTGGYWHNINIQMNYWPVFNTNLSELFQPFVDYNEAYRKQAEELATSYIKKYNPAALSPNNGDNGWTIGTGANAYSISSPGGHSGPGTGGLTAKLFWDEYDFTRDPIILENTVYPAITGMANFLSKVVKKEGEYLLTSPSYSPEQRDKKTGIHYSTIGCLFDQEMIFENHNDVIKASKILNNENEFVQELTEQLAKLDPIQIGASGQIKEYREENFYGEIGDPHHRHISHLVGLYPGTMINSNTPAWLDAAKKTLNLRGDLSTGWAMAHRLNLWARVKDGDRAYKIYQNLLQKGTLPNLWDTHPPFQIDGNFGGTAGVAEMLLQSHEGYIDILPALPTLWDKGFYEGLMARGNFEISVAWSNSSPYDIFVKSNKGGICTLRYPNLEKSIIEKVSNKVIIKSANKKNFVSFETNPGEIYHIKSIPLNSKVFDVSNLLIKEISSEKIILNWEKSANATVYNVYSHTGDLPDYELIAKEVTDTSVPFIIPANAKGKLYVFKVIAINKNGTESNGVTVNLAPEKQKL